MNILMWDQVNAWRLAQHGLSSRYAREDFASAVMDTGGIQAQVMSAAEQAIWARVDGLTPQDVQAALWQDRTLVKTWAMRSTLHLMAADELPLYTAARSLSDNRNWDRYFARYGLTPTQQQDYLDAVPDVLGQEPMTREELADAVAGAINLPEARTFILSSGWGSPLKPSAFRGDLCFGPSQGQNVTFVNPKKWLGKWESVDPHSAMQEIARRFLRTYGPATPADFARWWWGGGGVSDAKKLFKSLGDEIEPVEFEGRPAFALRSTLESMLAHEPSGSVNLLPLFDAYTFCFGRSLLPKNHESKVFRPQGWVSAVVLVDGHPKGVWETKTRRSQTTVTVRLFSPLNAAIKRGITAEAERLGDFLNTPITLEYETIA